MKSKNKHLMINLAFVVCIIFLAQIACGTSTSEQLASALPPTAGAEQKDVIEPTLEQPKSEEPSKPTNTPKPTEIPSTPTPKPEPINIISQGFGQDGRELGYAFTVENPNVAYAFESSQYQVAVYDENGTVLTTDSGYMELILPSQKMGVGGTIYLDEGVKAAKVEFQLNAGDAEVTDLTTSFSADKVSYQSSEYMSEVVGVISNPYDRDIENLRVSAVAYNDAGEIIGGGFTYLNFILAKSTTGTSVNITSFGLVAKVELYPTVSGLSTLTSDRALPNGAQDLVLEKNGFGQDGYEVGFGILIQNPNSNFSVMSTMYHITLFAEDGSVISIDEGYVDTILPNQTLGIGGDILVAKELVVAKADFQIMSGNFEASNAVPTFTSNNVTYKAESYSPKVTGEIVSPYTKDITNLRVSAIAYNEAGEIIGGGFTFLDFAPANGKAAVDISITTAGIPATVEIYATVSSLSDIE